jgi:hypothetical protein
MGTARELVAGSGSWLENCSTRLQKKKHRADDLPGVQLESLEVGVVGHDVCLIQKMRELMSGSV